MGSILYMLLPLFNKNSWVHATCSVVCFLEGSIRNLNSFTMEYCHNKEHSGMKEVTQQMLHEFFHAALSITCYRNVLWDDKKEFSNIVYKWETLENSSATFSQSNFCQNLMLIFRNIALAFVNAILRFWCFRWCSF